MKTLIGSFWKTKGLVYGYIQVQGIYILGLGLKLIKINFPGKVKLYSCLYLRSGHIAQSNT